MVKQASVEAEITVAVTPATQYSPERATLTATLPIIGRPTSVEVYGPDTAFGEPRPATINWAGIGARVTATDAAVYAALIAKAAEVAPTLAPATGDAR